MQLVVVADRFAELAESDQSNSKANGKIVLTCRVFERSKMNYHRWMQMGRLILVVFFMVFGVRSGWAAEQVSGPAIELDSTMYEFGKVNGATP